MRGRLLPSLGRAASTGLVVALALGGCGDADDGRGAADAAGRGSSADSVVAEAKALTSAVRKGLVYSTVYTPTNTAQIVPYGSWRGPKSAPKPRGDVVVEVITCAKTAIGCQQVAEAAIEAAHALGWKADLIDGQGTPQGYARAFNTALSRNPDAIVAVAVPTVAVGDGLAAAEARGVVTSVVADIEPERGQKYDSYVPYPSSAMAAIAAWTAIADTSGQAHGIVIRDTDYPLFVDSAAAYEDVMAQCSGCSVKAVDWQFLNSLDPTKVSKIVGGALANTPDATVIHVPYGSAIVNVTQAVAEAGKREQVAISSQGPDALAIRSVAQGDSNYTVGTSSPWAGWAAIDQVNRGLAGTPYLTPTEIGFGIAEFTNETAPASGNYDEWPPMVDYKSQYQRIWGVGQR